MTYEYNANDDRVFKQKAIFRNIENIYYLRDASGKEIAEYNVTNNTWIHYIHGRERIAEIDNETIKYFNSDHLGSNRIQYSVANNCDRGDRVFSVENANDYFAFGKTLRSFNNTGKYGFQGSEKDKELSDNSYFTQFRGLETEIARWRGVDAKVDKYPTMSPYVFAANNPVMFVDVDGRDILPSKAFSNSEFSSVLKDLQTNNSVFQKALGKYANDKNFNLHLDINDNAVPEGKSANTDYAYNWKNIKGVRTSTAAEAKIDFRTTAAGETNVLGRVTLLLHEYFHAYMGLKAVDSKNDPQHDKWDNYLNLMKDAVREYGKDNNLKLSETQVTELSIFNAGEGTTVFDGYIKKMAETNKTTVKQERAAFDSRILELVGESVKLYEINTK